MGEVPRQATNEEFIEKYMAEAGRYPGAREEAGAFLDDETGGPPRVDGGDATVVWQARSATLAL